MAANSGKLSFEATVDFTSGAPRADVHLDMSNAAAIKKMSDTVLFCELRAAWTQVECDVRHGQQPSKADSDYIAALTAEQKRRAA